MSKDSNPHPSHDELAAFLAGRLDLQQQSRVERHVQDCDRCCRVLQEQPEDTLVERLRDAETSFGTSAPNRQQDRRITDQRIPPPLRDHQRYRVIERIGFGGMGVVFRAEHRLMGRPVALKVINPALIDNAEAVVRFRTEVKAAATLDHPNIVRAYDAEQADDLHLLVMEFVDGISLAELVQKRGPMSISHACIVARKIAFGLHHAARHGMVHRDIKPQNVMLTRAGQVKILDFGLARLARISASDSSTSAAEAAGRSESALTQLGALLGTPDYMAPEQADDSHTVDMRADIYSLGCTLYYLLSGRPPFPSGSTYEKLVSHREREAPNLSDRRSDVSPELAAVVARMMAKDPADRFRTPADAAEALLPFARSSAPISRSKTTQAQGLADLVAGLEEAALGESLTTEFDHLPPRPATSEATQPQSTLDERRSRRRFIVAGSVVAAASLLIGVGYFAFFGGSESAEGSGEGPPEQQDPSAAAAGSSGKSRPRVLMVIPHDGFWNPDYEPVRRGLEAQGVHVRVASSARSAALPFPDQGEEQPVVPDLLISEADPADYDAVVFTGQCVKAVKHNEFVGDTVHARHAKRFMRQMLATDKFVTSVCGGTDVLADAGVLLGRAAAHHQYLDAEAIRDSGAEWDYERPVVVSHRIITARLWTDADVFVRTLLGRIKQPR